MPELPDITVYLEALDVRITGRPLEAVRLQSLFLLRSVEPPLASVEGRTVVGFRRIGKRIVFELEGSMFMVLHLMIAGRLHWKPRAAKPPGKRGLAAFDFPDGTLLLTESGTKKRASLFVVDGETALEEHDPGGVDVSVCDLGTFAKTVAKENRTLKRLLTDPRLLSGIGNAYSDEILHRACMSPFARSGTLDDTEIKVLFESARDVLREWTARLRVEAAGAFPEKVTAFRKEMAVHGRYGQPCPVCGSPVQRIVYAGNEANYCTECQTAGRLLADRALSRLLKDDWPKTLEEMEQRRRGS
jgi:formamidopyrimidine-DNA glycosylase